MGWNNFKVPNINIKIKTPNIRVRVSFRNLPTEIVISRVEETHFRAVQGLYTAGTFRGDKDQFAFDPAYRECRGGVSAIYY